MRDLVLTLALSEHESGAPVVMTIASKEPKTQKAKIEGELTAAKHLYEMSDLPGATITADALHCEFESMQQVVGKGGDFLFQLKNNQPTAFGRAEKIAATPPPFFLPAHARSRPRAEPSSGELPGMKTSPPYNMTPGGLSTRVIRRQDSGVSPFEQLLKTR